MARVNEFSENTKRRACLRQWGRCAGCGHPISEIWDHAHHINPIMTGGSADVDNCVILCENCHEHVHNDGDYRSGIVAPAAYYRYMYGPR